MKYVDKWSTTFLKELRKLLREFNDEPTGFVFWTGFICGGLLGLSVSIGILLYFNAMM